MRRNTDAFTKFMLYANSLKLTSQDHIELSQLHRVVSSSTKLLNILPNVVNSISAESYSRLLSVSSVFDISPIELKAYMLLVSGVRSVYMGDNNVKEIA